MKTCRLCGVTKPFTEFYKATAMRDGLRNDCIECNKALRKKNYAKNRETYIARAKRWQRENRDRHVAWQRKYREENREWMREKDRKRWLAAKYSLTPEEFEKLLERQRGACAICGVVMGKDLHVDHDHEAKFVRGLLCGSCNRGIGLLKENPETLRRAAEYMTDSRRKLRRTQLLPNTQPYEDLFVEMLVSMAAASSNVHAHGR